MGFENIGEPKKPLIDKMAESTDKKLEKGLDWLNKKVNGDPSKDLEKRMEAHRERRAKLDEDMAELRRVEEAGDEIELARLRQEIDDKWGLFKTDADKKFEEDLLDFGDIGLDLDEAATEVGLDKAAQGRVQEMLSGEIGREDIDPKEIEELALKIKKFRGNVAITSAMAGIHVSGALFLREMTVAGGSIDKAFQTLLAGAAYTALNIPFAIRASAVMNEGPAKFDEAVAETYIKARNKAKQFFGHSGHDAENLALNN